MAVRIKQLRCRVTVRTGGKQSTVLHQPEKAAKPSMTFAMAPPEPHSEAVQVEPSATATQSGGSSVRRHASPNVTKADVRAVSERVYELMREEIRRGKERHGRQ